MNVIEVTYSCMSIATIMRPVCIPGKEAFRNRKVCTRLSVSIFTQFPSPCLSYLRRASLMLTLEILLGAGELASTGLRAWCSRYRLCRQSWTEQELTHRLPKTSLESVDNTYFVSIETSPWSIEIHSFISVEECYDLTRLIFLRGSVSYRRENLTCCS